MNELQNDMNLIHGVKSANFEDSFFCDVSWQVF